MTVITVSNASQLSNALQNVKGGDTIRLAGGDYGDFVISGKSYASDVTITSADDNNPAVFNSLVVKGSANINLQGLDVDFTPTAATTSFSSAVLIEKSSGITFADGVIKGGPAVSGVSATATAMDSTGNVIGFPTGRGVTIQNSTDVTIADSDISQFHRGVAIGDSTHVTISDNEIHHMRTTAIVGGGSDLMIEGNYLHSSHPWRVGQSGGDHADFIALWTNPKQVGPTDNVTVMDNTLSQGDGAVVLGMWFQGGAVGFTNVVVEGNAILGGDAQGIVLTDVAGGRITDNVLLQSTTYEKAPGIVLGFGAKNLDASGNITWTISDKNAGSTGNVIHDNLLAQKADGKLSGFTSASSLNYYDSSLISKVLSLSDVDAMYDAAWSSLTTGGVVVAKPAVTAPVVKAPVVTQPIPTPEPEPVTVNQSFVGGSAVNIFTGGAGNDTLDGGGGVDSLSGGAGNDTYIIPNALAQIFESAGGGVDTVIARGDYILGANVENLVVSSTAANNWAGTGNEMNNVLTGNAGGNKLSGMGGNDTINGGAGNDWLYGDAGADAMNGEVGNDAMWGGAGADTMSGGTGADQMWGGAGADRFMMAKGFGGDKVYDFSAAEGDKVMLASGTTYTVSQAGKDTVINLGDGDQMILVGVQHTALPSGWIVAG